MDSSVSLRQKFKNNFPQEQADLLADSFIDAFSAQEQTLNEVHKLRLEVTRLAEAQTDLAEAQKRTEIKVEELADAQKETEKSLQLLARQVGGLSEKLGGTLEDLALETVPYVLKEEWGLMNIHAQRDSIKVGNEEIEIDLVIKGSLDDGKPLTVLGEVKSNLTRTEVERFLKKVEFVREQIPNPIKVLFFGFRVNLEARDLIRDSKSYMLFSNGRFLKVYP